MLRFLAAACAALLAATTSLAAAPAENIRVLFLGDNGPHRPAERFRQLAPVLAERGIELIYTDRVEALNAETLAECEALLIYANFTQLAPAQERALLDFVESGKGFLPIHCASACFNNSPAYIALVGARFERHGAGVFRTTIAEPRHPLMQGFGGFESWDETYVHGRHNEQGRTVLEYRVEGDVREPWTWVRTQGRGRVFYTAWGHDQRTWGHPGFHNLIERGIRWSVGGDPSAAGAYTGDAPFPIPELAPRPADLRPFEYVDVGDKIPHYAPRQRSGRPRSQMQQPLPPEESLRRYVTPAGFELQLFASEADLDGKPIAMAWDEQGRLWLAETYDYPNELQPPGRGRDRIRICEDTTGDGRADKFTVFAENLSIPTAIAFHRGGAIVQDGVETVYLKDTTGDGRADQRQVLITGWGMGDTHGGVSNFQYGLDNWLWAMQGYNNSAPVVNGRRQQAFRMGFFRFRPDASELEFLRSTNNNTWGLGFSEEGIVFGSTANRNPSVYLPIPNRYYERVRGWAPEQLGTIADTHLFRTFTDNIRQVDHHGGYTAAAGHALYTARQYPPEYWNRAAFVCEPTGHLVGAFVLKGEGADFKSHNPFNLVASDDEWAAPIMAEVGPDGNVWILDWYNYIVQHNPTPAGFRTGRGNAYESDLRDKKHGRIYRLVYKDAQPYEPLSLAAAEPAKLVATLRHETMLWRKHAQRLLVERGQLDVAPQLLALVADTSVDDIGLNVGAIHALWTLHGLGALDGSRSDALAAVHAALRHPSAGVRRNAAQVLPPSAESTAAILAARLPTDADPQVRLAALLALADMPADPRAAAVVAELAVRSDIVADRWLADALTSAAATHAADFLASLADKKVSPREARAQTLVTAVAEHLARGNPPAAEFNKLLRSLATADRGLLEAVLEGLSKGWSADHKLAIAAEAEQALVARAADLGPGAKGRLISLAPRWGSTKLAEFASELAAAQLQTLADAAAPTPQRLAAARQLTGFLTTDPQVVAAVLGAITPQAPPELAVGLIEALSASRAENVGAELVRRFPEWTPATRAAALRVLLGRPETTAVLLRGIEAGEVSLGDLTLDQKQALAEHPDRTLRGRARELLRRGGGLPNPDRERVLQELAPLAQRTGDAALGKAVFTKQCAKCHTHSGEGQKIGPDLTGMAVHTKLNLLTEIIDPSRSVEGNYRTYSVITVDGRIFNGMLAAESRTSIEIIDTEAKRHSIQRDDIEELVASPKSLMPEGFEKQVTPEEIVHLLEFLTKRGRYTPVPLDKFATIVSTKGMFNTEQADIERLIFSDWSPKTFEGVPFTLVDPQGDRTPNVIMLHGRNGAIPPKMPRQVTLPCNQPVRAIHLLSGVSGWGAPASPAGTLTMTVRLHYADGETEDHRLINGRHFADYIRRVDVPDSKFAFALRGQQIRYLAIHPQRSETIESIDFIKGDDVTSPVVMAVTLEGAPETPAEE